MAISKRTRFEVFKRDRFTLQIKAMKDYYVISRIISLQKEEDFKEVTKHWYKYASGYLGFKEESSLRAFLKDFSVEEIKNAIDIATSKVYGWNNKFRYMCGILYNWRKQRNGQNPIP